MKSIGICIFALAVSTGAFAHPFDIENNARWLALDSIAMPAGFAHGDVAMSNLRSKVVPGATASLDAVCGTVAFSDEEAGATNFVVFYAPQPGGGIAALGPPFFYGTDPSLISFDPEERVVQAACGDDGASPPSISASR